MQYEVLDEAIKNNLRVFERSIELLEENNRVEMSELKKEIDELNKKVSDFYHMVKGIKIITRLEEQNERTM